MQMRSPDILVAFGLAVRKARKRKGLSQESLADLCGLHRTYIGGVERGERNLTLKSMVQISSALDTSVSKLVAEAELI